MDQLNKNLPFIYLITNRKLCHPKPLEEVVHEALDAGIRFVQLREKDLNSSELSDLAKKIKTLTEKYKAHLLINEKIDVAIDVGADGVHLPGKSIPVAEARKLLGENKIIGKSLHLPLSLNEGDYKEIDFVTLSPIFQPGVKDFRPETIGIERLKEVLPKISVPVYALGGIKPEHVQELKRGGVSGVAVMSGIMQSDNIKKRVEEYLKGF